MRIRLLGGALLATCAIALHRIVILVHLPPHHEPAALELGLGLLAVLTGVAGAALFVVGPALFRPYVWPPPENQRPSPPPPSAGTGRGQIPPIA